MRQYLKDKTLLSKLWSLVVLLCLFSIIALGDDAYDLWLKYRKIDDQAVLASYREKIKYVFVPGKSATMHVVGDELKRGLCGLLGTNISVQKITSRKKMLIVTSRRNPNSSMMAEYDSLKALSKREGYVIKCIDNNKSVAIVADEDIGLLYGVFHFLRLLQIHASLDTLDIVSNPAIQYRMLNHWDNLDGSVERGYAGKSLWKWDELPDRIDGRYHDYARANASLGINGVVLNNVNANPDILKEEYLRKTVALANVFRPFGIKVFLSINFSSPLSERYDADTTKKGGVGNMETADPLNPEVREWWGKKVRFIYSLIPDFGGFLVKANSEGMPGPNDYGRTHAEGANMLAEALEPFGGVVMWRGFVYNPEIDADRVKRAYKEFVMLDGQFHPNVFLQLKNGPLDFQPREPVQPLFSAMPKTPLILELQITQEYLGHSTHLVYLASMWKEYLEFDTYAKSGDASLASVIEGSVSDYQMTGIAGVANIGDDRNWCGHIFAQANWFAYGRLAWNPDLTAEQIADDWIRMTLSHDSTTISTIRTMMMGSWEACVDYMTPLGLHHIMEEGFHYGPGPQHDTGRVDWRSTYYHRADSVGIGFDRTSKGSDAVSQYAPPLRNIFDDVRTCPEKYLLWFHHVEWNHMMRSGKTLWQELCGKYYAGTEYVEVMISTWSSIENNVNSEIFAHVKSRLEKQAMDAAIWRDTCLPYFQRFSRQPIYPPDLKLNKKDVIDR